MVSTLYLLLLICLHLPPQHTLSPDAPNVCLFDENYIQKVESRELVPVKVTRIQWCMKMPPRCIVEETEMRWQTVIKEVPRMRLVAKCCAGYAADLNDTKCVAVCSEPCVHGVCTSPDNCTCESGFMGSQCTKECSEGLWGRSCVEKCDCEHAVSCGSVHGDCNCLSGWQGTRCDLPCYEGSFGANCRDRCKCNGDLCHHITGICILPPTLPPTTTTTTSTTTSTTLKETTTPSTTLKAASMTVTQVTTAVYSRPTSTPKTFKQTTQTPNPVTRARTVTVQTNVNTSEVMKVTQRPLVRNVSQVENDRTVSKKVQKERISGRNDTRHSGARGNALQGQDDVTMLDDTEIGLAWLVIPLSVGVASILVVIFLCSMGLLMLSHYKKTREKTKRASARQKHVTKSGTQDIGVHKFYGEGVLPVKTVFENPVYSSFDCEGEDDPRQQPMLMSFKPPSESSTPRVMSMVEAHYDHPPSNRTTAEPEDEPFYDEISVCQNYDIPRLSYCRVSTGESSC